MNTKIIGVIVFVLLGVGIILGGKFIYIPMAEKAEVDKTHQDRIEANHAQIDAEAVIQADNFFGYWFATQSKEFVKACLDAKIQHKYVAEDPVDYKQRLEANISLMPVSQVVLHGPGLGNPVDIFASCDTSRDADAIVIRKDRFPKVTVDVLDDAAVRIALTPGSPSSDLMNLTIDALNFVHLKPNGPWMVEAKSSADALEMLVRGDVPAAVGWEPDISRLLKRYPGEYVVVWGSKNHPGKILDVFVANSKWLAANREAAYRFMLAYFTVVQKYSGPESRDALVSEMVATPSLGLSRSEIESALRKIDYHTLGQNITQMFPVGGNQEEGVLDAVLYWRDLYRSTGQLGPNDLDNPKLIINTGLLQQLKETPLATQSSGASAFSFAPLSDAQWSALPRLATVNFDQIQFSTGSHTIPDGSIESLRGLGERLTKHFPENRVLLAGYALPGDGTDGRIALAERRAQSVADFLVHECGIERNRIHVEGRVSTEEDGPKRVPGEPYKTWRARFSRVEVHLLESDNL